MKTKIKTFFKNFILDIILFSLLFSAIYGIRTLIINALNKLQILVPQLSQLEQSLQQAQNPEALAQLQQTLNSVNHITQYALFLGIILLPFAIYFLWTLAQSLHYTILNKQRITLRTIARYLLFMLPLTIIYVAIFSRILTLLAPIRDTFLEPSPYIAYEFGAYLIIIFISIIIIHIAFSNLTKQTIKSTLLTTLKLTTKKWYIILPLGILISTSYAFIIYYLFTIYLGITQTGNYIAGISGILISVIILTFFRTILHSFLTRQNQKNS